MRRVILVIEIKFGLVECGRGWGIWKFIGFSNVKKIGKE